MSCARTLAVHPAALRPSTRARLRDPVRVGGGRLVIESTSTAYAFGEPTTTARRSRGRRRSRPPEAPGPAAPAFPTLPTLPVRVAGQDAHLSLLAWRQLLHVDPDGALFRS